MYVTMYVTMSSSDFAKLRTNGGLIGLWKFNLHMIERILRSSILCSIKLVVPSKSKDGSTTPITPDKIMKHWTEHFTDFCFNQTVVDGATIDSILQHNCIYSLDEESSLDETINFIKQINTGKAPTSWFIL